MVSSKCPPKSHGGLQAWTLIVTPSPMAEPDWSLMFGLYGMFEISPSPSMDIDSYTQPHRGNSPTPFWHKQDSQTLFHNFFSTKFASIFCFLTFSPQKSHPPPLKNMQLCINRLSVGETNRLQRNINYGFYATT